MGDHLRVMAAPWSVDLTRTLFPLRRGTGDPTMRIGIDQAWRATRTPDGPATVHLQLDPSTGAVRAQAWGLAQGGHSTTLRDPSDSSTTIGGSNRFTR